MARAYRVVDDFAPEVRAARAVFDERFADPRRAAGNRFVWDWWHVPGQYTQLRTPAWPYFPATLYRALHGKLVDWGRRHLGCHAISPPWLSLYVDGCGQELHGDLPHGPFAFVLSLTRWTGRRFTGGETVLLRDDVLDYWSGFVSERSVEQDQLVHAIPPRFGRLVVFDPRIPHGVRRVAGTVDPRDGRLVINGWFVQPRPFVVGPLGLAAVQRRIDDLGADILQWTRDGIWVTGTLAFRIDVRPGGTVRAVRILSDTTRAPRGDAGGRPWMIRQIKQRLARWQLPRRRGPSTITLPLVFSVG